MAQIRCSVFLEVWFQPLLSSSLCFSAVEEVCSITTPSPHYVPGTIAMERGCVDHDDHDEMEVFQNGGTRKPWISILTYLKWFSSR